MSTQPSLQSAFNVTRQNSGNSDVYQVVTTVNVPITNSVGVAQLVTIELVHSRDGTWSSRAVVGFGLTEEQEAAVVQTALEYVEQLTLAYEALGERERDPAAQCVGCIPRGQLDEFFGEDAKFGLHDQANGVIHEIHAEAQDRAEALYVSTRSR